VPKPDPRRTAQSIDTAAADMGSLVDLGIVEEQPEPEPPPPAIDPFLQPAYTETTVEPSDGPA
jgi:hypothetical protein